VRAREAAKKDQLRARHRLSKFLLRQGRRPPEGTKAWTLKYMAWLKVGVRFEQPAQEATLLDYLTEVEHAVARIKRLERAIDEAVAIAPAKIQAVVDALQALRGVAKVSAVTIACEVGEFSRFEKATQLMAYAGVVAREHSSGERTWRGGITKTGNAHLRRIVVEAAWAYRHRPSIGRALCARQSGISEEVKEIAWKAQHRLCAQHRKLVARGKSKQLAVTAVARELLGFIWAIGVKVEQQTHEHGRLAA
jgi:transposase